MKRYYIPKTLTAEVVASPLLVVAGNWFKWFDSATKAKRSSPPVGIPTGRQRGTRLGWTFSPTDEYRPRLVHNTYLEVNQRYLHFVVRRLRDTHRSVLPKLTQFIVYLYMLIPAPDYARFKTNHKIGAPKGRLP